MKRIILSFILIVGSAAALLTLAVTIKGTFAQDVTATPSSGVPTPLPYCDPYHVAAESANIRTCAATTCRVVSNQPQNSMLCVRGEADSDAWLQVDLAPDDTTSPIYYVSAGVVAPGQPGQTDPNCTSYLTSADTPIYSCAQQNCNVVGTIPTEGWLCAQDFGGQYPGWLYSVDSDANVAGWVQQAGLTAGQPNQVQRATWTPRPIVPEIRTTAGPTRTIAPPSITPQSGPITLTGAEPACQQYYVTVQSADARACAGAGCASEASIPRGQTVCIRGITENPEWLIVDLEPDTTGSPLYAINRFMVAPGTESMAATTTAADCEPWEVIVPSANVRECPTQTCRVLESLPQGTWFCARDFGGTYEDWVKADVPGGLTGGWVNADLVRQMAITGTPTTNAPALVSAQTTVTPTSAAETPATSALCQIYDVNVTSANIRSCASTDCVIVGRAALGEQICVLGPATGAEATWFMIDQTPGDPADAPAYISQNLLNPGTAGAGTPVPSATAVIPTIETTPTITPTPTPFVTLLPTPIFTPAPTGMPDTPVLSKEVILSTLRVRNFELVSPRGSNRFRFQLPDDWYMDGSSVLYLNIEYFENRAQAAADVPNVPLTSVLDVKLDDTLVSAVSLDNTVTGPQTVAIPLPANLMADPDRRNHTIEITLEAEDYCLLDSEARVFVRTDMSYFRFEFRELAPLLDLARYPRPFYNQRFADDPEAVLMVLPLDANANDMQAAARLAAGLGYLTGKELRVDVVTAENITEDQRTNNNLLLVGQLGTNPLIDELYASNSFPTTLDETGALQVSGQPVNEGDGVVELIANPLNPMRAVLAVTGRTPEALLKASQALAGPPSIMGIGGPLALISDTRPAERAPAGTTLNADITFTQLGYPELTLSGVGTLSAEVEFYMPLGQTLTDDAYVDLLFTYSEVLQTGRTTVAVVLNETTPLASEVLGANPNNPNEQSSDAQPNSPNHLRAWIPPTSIIPGQKNVLTIFLTVEGQWECDPPDPSIAWFTISGDSVLHLPRQISDAALFTPMVGWFPIPFNAQPDLSDVWISIPDEPTQSDLEQAFRFAALLGSSVANGEGLTPHIQIGSLPEGADLSAYHFIVLGMPSTNSFLSMLNANLPQPFVPDTDELEQKLDDVSYRLPPGYEVGVLETLPSPWASDRAILVVTGTGAESQANAASALLDEKYGRSDLLGDVIYVSNNSVSAVNTYLLAENVLALTAIPDLGTQTAMELSATPEPAGTSTPGPTLTPQPSATLGPSPTPTLLFTETPVPMQSTPLPTLVPITAQEAQPTDPELPGWFDILLIVTGGAIVVMVGFGLVQFLRRGRTRAV